MEYKPVKYLPCKGFKAVLSKDDKFNFFFPFTFDMWSSFMASSVQQYLYNCPYCSGFVIGALYRDVGDNPRDFEISMGGSCHKGEAPSDSIDREILEEMGIVTQYEPQELFTVKVGKKKDTLFLIDLDQGGIDVCPSSENCRYFPDGEDSDSRKVHCFFYSQTEKRIEEVIKKIMTNKLGKPVHENIIGFMIVSLETARNFMHSYFK